MKTLNHSYLSRLDHLRFFAAALVILYHCRGSVVYNNSLDSISDYVKLWISHGNTGVSLFLVLSGFLFCIISDAGMKNISYGNFVKNRVLRIAPMAVLLCFIAISVSRATSTPMDILRILTLQLNTGHPSTGWGNQFYPVGQIWTIAVEFQFYLIFPFLAVFMRNDGVKTLAGIILVMLMIKYSLTTFSGAGIYWVLYHTIIGRLDQFIVGMIAGVIYIKRSENNLLLSSVAIIFSIAALTSLLYMNGKKVADFVTFSFTLEAIIWSVIIYFYSTASININNKIDSALSYLGGLSFSMYLLHLPVYYVLQRKFLPLDPSPSLHVAKVILIVIPVTIIASSITYRFIEKPFLGLRVKYTK
ncbi:TPA: acyltransferase [Enterobacter cloacae]|uniref:acyltransferase family protein n=1 Tax=Enterobacter cloacae TaxID=550 RepID=UPI001C5A7641|nr:acyltransferase [Enterobacter cloacae]MBW4228331.1 acyltransferase [Enterobacter cloacae subsp. cloacae]HEB0916339.1 acyltransferase [Enterobacter cloacae]HEB0921378.1 acyltransferase [Enterobacter cloacae]HEB0926149.1 acyltransferase [Enterobacter cloacae]HEB0936385.1 acyltransferase [Enterobacter cloacae]